MAKALDLSGTRFGRLVAQRRNGHRGKQVLWLCVCDCGNEATTTTHRLQSGATRSCGCLYKEAHANGHAKKTHGMHGTAIHGVWKNMLGRCRNPSDAAYANYGGRGISVCEQWLSFASFYADMGDPPAGMSIERRDNDGPYTKDNCYWATRTEQVRNRRNSIKVTLRGETRPLKVWCEEFGVAYPAAHRRLKRGLPLERVFASGRQS